MRDESALLVEFGTVDATILGTKTYTVSPFVYWASNGALVLDYAVSPDVSAGVPSWWESMYGNLPDLTMKLPWKYDAQKGIGSTNPEVQKEETRDIIFSPIRPVSGEEVTISARIQNYSLVDNFTPFNVRFYLDDPRNGGILIEDRNGETDFEIPSINARKSHIVNLEGWIVPEDANRDTKIYVVIDEENAVNEVHENNNIAWALVNPNLGIGTSNEKELAANPQKFRLLQNYPNPFNPTTMISYYLSVSEEISLKVFDLTGREVAELVNQWQSSGTHQVLFDASGLASGIYFYRISGEMFIETKKMMLIK